MVNDRGFIILMDQVDAYGQKPLVLSKDVSHAEAILAVVAILKPLADIAPEIKKWTVDQLLTESMPSVCSKCTQECHLAGGKPAEEGVALVEDDKGNILN
jgi:hypothetical protein